VLRVTVPTVLLAALLGSAARAQTPGASPVQLAQATTKVDSAKHRDASAFFESQDPVEVTLTTNIGKIRGDKGDNPPWRPATLSYKALEGSLVTVPIKARTRGIWRLKMCDFPPLRLNFSGATSKGTIFHNLDKPKLVNYCQNADNYEQYILQEYQLYRVYQLITPVSHKARLIKFIYADSADGKVRARRYGFIMEEPKALAARLGGKVMEQKGAGGERAISDQIRVINALIDEIIEHSCEDGFGGRLGGGHSLVVRVVPLGHDRIAGGASYDS
jgi:hypothetical protein